MKILNKKNIVIITALLLVNTSFANYNRGPESTPSKSPTPVKVVSPGPAKVVNKAPVKVVSKAPIKLVHKAPVKVVHYAPSKARYSKPFVYNRKFVPIIKPWPLPIVVSAAIRDIYLSAVRGDPYAMSQLSYHYYAGTDIQRDLSHVHYWAQQGANAGSPDAMYRLASCYEFGEGVAKSNQMAFYWHLKAAEGGYVDSFEKVADAYEYGNGVSQDNIKALYWAQMATKFDTTKDNMDKVSRIYAKLGNEPEAILWSNAGNGDTHSLMEVSSRLEAL